MPYCLSPRREQPRCCNVFAMRWSPAGCRRSLLTVLGEETERVRDAIAAGVDHIVLTGSARTGRAVQQLIADAGRPIGLTAELSGADVCLLLPGADLVLAAKAVRFGATLNRGHTCIAPRIVLVPAATEAIFLNRLRRALARCWPTAHEFSGAARATGIRASGVLARCDRGVRRRGRGDASCRVARGRSPLGDAVFPGRLRRRIRDCRAGDRVSEALTAGVGSRNLWSRAGGAPHRLATGCRRNHHQRPDRSDG